MCSRAIRFVAAVSHHIKYSLLIFNIFVNTVIKCFVMRVCNYIEIMFIFILLWWFAFDQQLVSQKQNPVSLFYRCIRVLTSVNLNGKQSNERNSIGKVRNK